MTIVKDKQLLLLEPKGHYSVEEYCVYYDAYQEAKWFQSLNPAFRKARLVEMTKATRPEITRLLRYDRPDIILTLGGKAVIALEKTTEVPTGHNVGQRFARIVCAAEEHVPFVYFFPFVAKKHGDYASPCWINARLLDALRKMRQIHSTPILAIDWICDRDYELVRDGSQDQMLCSVINDFIKHSFNLGEVSILEEVYTAMNSAYKSALSRHPQYAQLPKSASVVSTEDYLKRLSTIYVKSNLQEIPLKLRMQSLVYDIGMRYIRSDPYTGTQILYDYVLARVGPTPRDRVMNIVLNMPNITLDMWKKAASRQDRKDVKLYTRFADLVVLKDDLIIP